MLQTVFVGTRLFPSLSHFIQLLRAQPQVQSFKNDFRYEPFLSKLPQSYLELHGKSIQQINFKKKKAGLIMRMFKMTRLELKFF